MELGIADAVLPFKSNTYTDERELVALKALRDAMKITTTDDNDMTSV